MQEEKSISPEPEQLKLEQHLKPRVVAKRLDVGISTVYHWGEKGILPMTKLGGAVRFSESAVAKRLEELRQKQLPKVA